MEIFAGTPPNSRDVRLPAQGNSPVGDITLNFVNVDTREIIRSVLGETLGLNVVVDARIQGQLTIQTFRPLRREALYETMENVLRMNGVALSRQGDIVSAVPVADVRGARGGGTSAVRVIPVKFISPTELAGILKSFGPGDLQFIPAPTRGMVFAIGPLQQMELLDGITDTFDVDWLSGMSFGLYRPHYARAQDVMAELSSIFGAGGRNPASSLRFVPITRLNTILGLSPNVGLLREVGAWVERLDQGTDSEEKRIFVYRLQHARVADLAPIVGKLFSTNRDAARGPNETDSAPFQAASPLAGVPNMTLPEGTRSGSGTPGFSVPSRGGGGLTSGENAGGPLAAAARTPVLEPDTSDVLMGPLTPDRTSGADTPRIIADETDNALIVQGTVREYRAVEKAIAELDVAPLQVLIEAVIAEVTLNNELKYGLQWYLASGKLSGTLSPNTNGSVAASYPGIAAVFSSNSVNVVLSALESRTKVNVISSPSMMVLDNRTANLLVGDQVPIATQQATNTVVAGAPIVNSIEYKDTGVILKVTPHVSDGGSVRLDIDQEVSDVIATTTSTLTSPTIEQRKFSSSVSVRDGESIALGGLISDRHEVDNGGVPLLKDIPYIGNLFKTVNKTTARTELIVLLTPHVVRSDEEIRQITSQLRDQMQEIPVIPAHPHRYP